PPSFASTSNGAADCPVVRKALSPTWMPLIDNTAGVRARLSTTLIMLSTSSNESRATSSGVLCAVGAAVAVLCAAGGAALCVIDIGEVAACAAGVGVAVLCAIGIGDVVA